MSRIVKEDLRYNSYTIKVRQMLFEAVRTKRIERCNLLLCSLQNSAAGGLSTGHSGPPNSPDLNPLDFYVCSVVESATNKSRHPKVASLRAAIEAAFADMDRDSLKRACRRFRPRMKEVIQAEGGYIE